MLFRLLFYRLDILFKTTNVLYEVSSITSLTGALIPSHFATAASPQSPHNHTILSTGRRRRPIVPRL